MIKKKRSEKTKDIRQTLVSYVNKMSV